MLASSQSTPSASSQMSHGRGRTSSNPVRRSRASELLRSLVTSSPKLASTQGEASTGSTAGAPYGGGAALTWTVSGSSSSRSSSPATTSSNFVGNAARRALSPSASARANSQALALHTAEQTASFTAASSARREDNRPSSLSKNDSSTATRPRSRRTSTSYESKYVPHRESWYAHLGFSFELKEIPGQLPPPQLDLPEPPTPRASLKSLQEDAEVESGEAQEPKTPTQAHISMMETPAGAAEQDEGGNRLDSQTPRRYGSRNSLAASSESPSEDGSTTTTTPPHRSSMDSKTDSDTSTVFHSPASSPMVTPRSSCIGSSVAAQSPGAGGGRGTPAARAGFPRSFGLPPRPLPIQPPLLAAGLASPITSAVSSSSNPSPPRTPATPTIPARNASRAGTASTRITVTRLSPSSSSSGRRRRGRRVGVHSLPADYVPPHLSTTRRSSRPTLLAQRRATTDAGSARRMSCGGRPVRPEMEARRASMGSSFSRRSSQTLQGFTMGNIRKSSSGSIAMEKPGTAGGRRPSTSKIEIPGNRRTSIVTSRRGSEAATERLPTPTSTLMSKAKAARHSKSLRGSHTDLLGLTSASVSLGSPNLDGRSSPTVKAMQLAMGAWRETPTHLLVQDRLPSPKLGAQRPRTKHHKSLPRSVDLSLGAFGPSDCAIPDPMPSTTPSSPPGSAFSSPSQIKHQKRLSSLSTFSVASTSNSSMVSAVSSDPPITPRTPAHVELPMEEEYAQTILVSSLQGAHQLSSRASTPRVKPTGPRRPSVDDALSLMISPVSEVESTLLPSVHPKDPTAALKRNSADSILARKAARSLEEELSEPPKPAPQVFPWEGIRQRAELRGRSATTS